jgi:transposase-like protein
MAGQRGSGLSVRAYCRRHRLRESAFYFWRKELTRRGASAAMQAAFVPVRITREQPATPSGPGDLTASGRIEIVLGSDRRVNVVGPVDRQALADVLAVLSLDPAARYREGATC